MNPLYYNPETLQCVLCKSIYNFNKYYQSIQYGLDCNSAEFLHIAEEASDWLAFIQFYESTKTMSCELQSNNTFFSDHIWKNFIDFTERVCNQIQSSPFCNNC